MKDGKVNMGSNNEGGYKIVAPKWHFRKRKFKKIFYF
jgi:hypothetical protein